MADGDVDRLDTSDERIAIIGLACRVPGAPDASAFWDNLAAGTESIARLDRAALIAAGNPSEIVDDPRYVACKGLLHEFDCFDAPLFGMSPREAEITDPQHRVFLENALAALEDAGYGAARYRPLTGIFAGAAFNTYLPWLLRRLPALGARDGMLGAMMGNASDYLATRVAYKLGLRGPAVAVQTACSTSLVAVHLAMQSLLAGECDLALAGGVTVRMPQVCGHLYQDGGILSSDGHCRPFDADASGTVNGCGVGIIVLRRLQEAVAAGDTVRAVLLGSAVNNDGAEKQAFSAPNPDAQSAVIAQALAVAGLGPDDIDYLEAHGTGTRLGDALELDAAARVFAGRSRPCVIGSAKANIGHLDAAAGVASLIKVVLALEQGKIPPLINYHTPNPRCEFERTCFEVVGHLADWPATKRPRRAGASSFGFGGTNVHVVVEEPPSVPYRSGDSGPQLLCLQAATSSALDRLAERLRLRLLKQPALRLEDVAHTLQVGRQPLHHRRALVAASREEALEALANGSGRRGEASSSAAVAFVLAGGGSLQPGIARHLYATDRVFQHWLDHCADEFARVSDFAIREMLIGFDVAPAHPTSIAEAAWFVFQVAMARTMMTSGLLPCAMLTAGVGEIAALTVAGALDLEDAVVLVAARAGIMPDRARNSHIMRSRLRTAAMTILSLDSGIRIDAGTPVDPLLWSSEKRPRMAIEDRVPLLGLAADQPLLVEIGSNDGVAGAWSRQANVMPSLSSQGTHQDHAVVLDVIGAAWVAGAVIDWPALHRSGQPRRVPLPPYPFERQRYLAETPAEPVEPPASSAPAARMWLPVWKRAAQRGRSQGGEPLVIAHHGDSFAQSLIAQLSAHVPVVVARAGAPLPPGAATRGSRLVYVCRVVPTLHDLPSVVSAEIDALLTLARSAPNDTQALDVVTSAAYEATGGDVLAPHGAAVAAFARVLRQEKVGPAIGRTIDADPVALDPVRVSEAAAQVAAALLCEAEHDLLCCRGKRRLARSFEPVATQAAGLRPGGVYLLCGGTGGIGTVLARHIARMPDSCLALLGRSSHRLDAADLAQRIEIPTDRLLVQAADATDASAVSSAVAAAVARFGPITGAVHLAGVTGAKAAGDLNAEEVARVLGPKLKGAAALVAALAEHNRGQTPDFVLLTSSLVALQGGRGLAAYAAANAGLEAYAAALCHVSGRRVVALALDRVPEVGMAAGATRRFDLDRWPWLAAEHRVGGRAIVPGTLLFGLLLEAAAAEIRSTALTVEELTFLRPVELSENGSTAILVALVRSSDDVWLTEAWLEAGGARGPIVARGRVRARHRPDDEEYGIELAALQARCIDDVPLPSAGDSFLLGPRWGCLRRLRAGRGEWLANIELAQTASADALAGPVHPALLDVALGAALGATGGMGCVPVRYRSFAVCAWPFPSRLLSHVRSAPANDDHCRFSITITDERGRTVLEAKDYLLRRAALPAASSAGRTSSLAPSIESSDGLSAVQVTQAFDRALALEGEPLVLACARDPFAATPLLDSADEATGASAIADPVERIARLIREVLGVPDVGPDDDFFGLGGDSILALDVISRLNHRRPSRAPALSPTDLYAHPTPRALAARCAATARPASDTRILLCRLRTSVPQERLRAAVNELFNRLPELPVGHRFCVTHSSEIDPSDGLTIHLFLPVEGDAQLVLGAPIGLLDTQAWHRVLSTLAQLLPQGPDGADVHTIPGAAESARLPADEAIALEAGAERACGCRLEEVLLAGLVLALAPHGLSVQAAAGRAWSAPLYLTDAAPATALQSAKAVLRAADRSDHAADALLRAAPELVAPASAAFASPTLTDGWPADLAPSIHHAVTFQWRRESDGALRVDRVAPIGAPPGGHVEDLLRSIRMLAAHCAQARHPTYAVSDFPHSQLDQESLDDLVAHFASNEDPS